MHEKNERFFVYFGSRNSLDIGGKMNFLEKLAAFDRFQYFDEDKQLQFYTSTKKKCGEDHGIPIEGGVKLFFENMQSKQITLKEKNLDYPSLGSWINFSIVYTDMRYNKRAELLLE